MSTSYGDLVNIPVFGKKRENFNPERGDIVFYCRDCRCEVVPIHLDPVQVGKKLREYMYQCPICSGKKVSIGTAEGVKEFYKRKGG
jgi:Zn finger protein HypA/HybF involved in hydrogenase expression